MGQIRHCFLLPVQSIAAVEVFVVAMYLLCLAAFVCGALWLLWPKTKRKVPDFPQVPGRLPVLGNFHQLGGPENLAAKFEEWVAEFGGEDGVCECRIAGCRYIIVGGHDAVLEVMRQRPYKLRRSAAVRNLDGLCGLFLAEGSDWRVQRRVFAPALSHAHMESYLPVMKKVAGKLVSTWRTGPGVVGSNCSAKGQPILDAMASYASDVTAIAGFGADQDSFGAPNPLIQDMNRIFAIALERTLWYDVFRYWQVRCYVAGRHHVHPTQTRTRTQTPHAPAHTHSAPTRTHKRTHIRPTQPTHARTRLYWGAEERPRSESAARPAAGHTATLLPVQLLPFGTYLDGLGQALGRVSSALLKVVVARADLHKSKTAGGFSEHAIGSSEDAIGSFEPATYHGTGAGTLLDSMMARVAMGQGRNNGTELFTHRTMVDNLITAFLAGTDTTGIALAWMLHTLALDAELQAECAAEALGVDVNAAKGAELMARLPTIRSLFWEVNRVNGPVSPKEYA
jgi:cytochrome P450